MTVAEGVRLAAGVVVLVVALYAVLRSAGARIGWAPVVAVVRGAVQIALVGLALRGALTAPPAVAVVLPVARRAVGEALVPVLDQIRTTGLVTLPSPPWS